MGATQRNLTTEGREQARRLGEAFRARDVPIGRVRSSLWCRCLDTAELAFGRGEPWPALNAGLATPRGSLGACARWKLVFLIAAFVNAGVFHRWPFRTVGDWDTELHAPRVARINGLLSVALWVGVIACGRLIAYF